MKKLNYSRSFLNDAITEIFKTTHGVFSKGFVLVCCSFIQAGLFAQTINGGESSLWYVSDRQ